jgi:hypothetical protein
MARHVSRHVVGYAALFVALGGVATAATELPRNSVTTKQVVNHSLLAVDFKARQLPAGPRGAAGAAGPAGPAGPAGATGPAGIASISTVLGPQTPECAGGGGACQVGQSDATCPAGSRVIAGAFSASTVDNEVVYTQIISAVTYRVISVNYYPGAATITAQATCVSGPGITAAAYRGSATSANTQLRLLRAQLASG